MKEIPQLNRKRKFTRRLLIGAVGLATLLAGFYAVADWRGRVAWQKCRQEMAARGESWDWSAYAPAPVPDDQNLFKAPKIAEWFGDNRSILQAPLDNRITNAFAQRYSNPATAADISTTAAALSYLSWSDPFQGDFDTIRSALQRPEARLGVDSSRPNSVILPNVATLAAVCKTLAQRAKCHLLLNQPDKAWEEVTLLHDMGRMASAQGRFITPETTWIHRELARHCWMQVIVRGTELHAWGDGQWNLLQEQLAANDFIAQQAQALKCGRALLLNALDDGDLFELSRQAGRLNTANLLRTLAPRGFTYQVMSGLARHFGKAIDALTPADAVLRPGEINQAFAFWKRAQEGLPALLLAQTVNNEGAIACALERYRLANHDYPETLEALKPQYIKTLPRDIVNGRPLIYRRENANFLLYSVGWNETDDGGTIAQSNGQPQLTAGDWVWKSHTD